MSVRLHDSEPRPSKKTSLGAVAIGWHFFGIWFTAFAAHLVLLAMRLANAPHLPWSQLAPFGAFTLAVFLEWLILRGRTALAETRLFQIATFLVGVGIAIQFRMGTFSEGAGAGFALSLPIGFAAMLCAYLLCRGGRWRKLELVGYLCYGIAVLGLIAMFAFGRRYRGGVYLPGNLNPSEIVKPLLVVFLASFFVVRQRDFSETQIGIPLPPARSLWLLAGLWFVPLALVLALHDLGLLLLLNATLVVMLYAIGRKAGYLVLGGIGVVASGALVYFTSAHARARFDVWLHPFRDPTGAGWQVLQGLSAMYSGGLWGQGIGGGSPESVPIVTSDFVYAAAAEEFGILLCALLLLLYTCLVWRGWRVAAQARTPFGALLAVGLTATLGFQALLNLAGVAKALPLTGITLPFLSQGGSSLVTMLAVVGLLGAISDGGAGRGKR